MASAAAQEGLRRSDVLLALGLALLISAAQAFQHWAFLRDLILPDTDDVMRLQQIRDWLGGQSWFDLSQHRLGFAPGLPMHWSRVDDLVPGGMIMALRPLVGTHSAELAAVLLWPGLLYATFILLSGRAALALEGSGRAGASTKTAMIIAALALPAVGMFAPGRIDHHGLQIVLLLAAVAGLVIEGTRARIFAGLACALSLAVGLETAPQIVALIGAALILGPGRNRVFLGALAGGVIVALPLFSIAQSIHMCDTLGAVLRHPQDCTTGPYGHVDPFLQRVWLHQVGEAQGLLHQPHPALIISYCTLLVAGCGAALWFARSRPEQRNACLLFAAPMLMSLAVALFQLRGAYIGAGLAAPVLAQMVGAARRKGALALAGAWLASAGVLHHLIGDDLDGAMARQEVVTAAQSPSFSSMGAGCIAPATLDALAKQHAGRIMAPMDVGSYLIAATPLRVFAAPYHRNNDGNLAMYHFFLASPDAAHAQARTLGVRYVLACPETFAEIKDEPQWPRSLAAMLHDGRAPGWLVPIPMAGSAAHLYDVQ